ncbi:hypothetical protein [Actinacidiphila sp. ITFR-21]|uniref:hypothetical protein n=1 Tax=Actinacidiphila sp. ITFR-21 TaxID=3075199 RepID=UPI00288A61A9|nr:hypothetical protein [Streptomyces sp. ITFR-21]WNI15745.1 hypothetical protein RLT57_09545 [Streptomyces sp. ITFR-21]
MDPLRYYSNATGVAADVAQSLAALGAELERGSTGRRSVSSARRTEQATRSEDKVHAGVVARIKREYVRRVVTYKMLAQKYGLSEKTVQRILRERRY